MAKVPIVELPWVNCRWASLMISQHWFRWWLGVVRQQAITWVNVDLVLCHHMVSLGHNGLTSSYWTINYPCGTLTMVCFFTSWWQDYVETDDQDYRSGIQTHINLSMELSWNNPSPTVTPLCRLLTFEVVDMTIFSTSSENKSCQYDDLQVLVVISKLYTECCIQMKNLMNINYFNP